MQVVAFWYDDEVRSLKKLHTWTTGNTTLFVAYKMPGLDGMIHLLIDLLSSGSRSHRGEDCAADFPATAP